MPFDKPLTSEIIQTTIAPWLQRLKSNRHYTVKSSQFAAELFSDLLATIYEQFQKECQKNSKQSRQFPLLTELSFIVLNDSLLFILKTEHSQADRQAILRESFLPTYQHVLKLMLEDKGQTLIPGSLTKSTKKALRLFAQQNTKTAEERYFKKVTHPLVAKVDEKAGLGKASDAPISRLLHDFKTNLKSLWTK